MTGAASVPDLDDLDPVQVARVRILDRLQQEPWRPLRARRGHKVAAHRRAQGIGALHPVGLAGDPSGIAEAGEQAEAHAYTGGGEHLLALHGVEQGLAGVPLGPDAGDPPCAQRDGPGPKHPVGVALAVAVAERARIVELLRGRDAGVEVRPPDHSQGERIDPQPLLLHQAPAERLAHQTAGAERRSWIGKEFEIGELVGRG